MKVKTKRLMFVSAVVGFSMFLVIHFTTLLGETVLLAAALQITANTFVFLSWYRGFRESSTRIQRLVTGVGFTVPLCMAGYTIARVILIPLLT